jgi:hypothetical protein
MRTLILLLLLLLCCQSPCHADDVVVAHAPAVVFRSVEWWGPGKDGAMWWWAGRNQTPHPADLGRTKEARLVGAQEIEWLGRTWDITQVTRSDTGAFTVTFEKWKLVMARTHEDRWLVDVFPPDARFVTGRFRTVTKATAHADGQ